MNDCKVNTSSKTVILILLATQMSTNLSGNFILIILAKLYYNYQNVTIFTSTTTIIKS